MQTKEAMSRKVLRTLVKMGLTTSLAVIGVRGGGNGLHDTSKSAEELTERQNKRTPG